MKTLVRRTADTARASIERAIGALFPKWYNKRFCSTEGLWNVYFERAEESMSDSWNVTIWPLIKDCDFDNVLELAPGVGRNTERLVRLARVIHAVDLNEYALKRLRERFRSSTGGCELHIYRNDGSDLGMIPSSSITLVYCWDAAVHFDKAVLKAYVREFARVLVPGGMGFIHHSNLGRLADVDITVNPHWRSNVSKELFADYCEASGLTVVQQVDLPWDTIVDCISIFRK